MFKNLEKDDKFRGIRMKMAIYKEDGTDFEIIPDTASS